MSRSDLLKKIIRISLIGIGMIIVLLFLAIVIFSDKIGEKAIAALQEKTTSKISVTQSRLSFLTYFPKAGIKLKGLTIEDIDYNSLLEAEEVTFKINLASLLGSKLELQSIKIRKATLRIIKDKNGRWNYDIFKKSDQESEQTAIQLSVQKATLEYCDVQYIDQLENVAVAVFILKSNINLEYQVDKLSILANGHSVLEHIINEGESYLVDKALRFDLHLKADLTENRYSFDSTKVILSGNPLDINGSIHLSEKKTTYDLTVVCQSSSLDQVVQLLPNDQLNVYNQLNPKGNVQATMSYKGANTAKEQPELVIKANIIGGALSSNRYQTNLEQLDASITLHNKINNTQISFSNTKGKLQKEPFSMKGVIDINKQSSYSVDISGKLPLVLVSSMAGLTDLERATGDVNFREVMIRFGPKYKTPSQGSIVAEKLKAKWLGNSIDLPRISISVEGDNLLVNDFQLNGWNSEIQFSGNIQDYLNVLDERKSPQYNLSLTSKRLDIDRLLIFFEEIEGAETQDSLKITASPGVFQPLAQEKIQLQTDLKNIKYQSLKIDQLLAVIELADKNINIEGRAALFGGSIEAKGTGKMDRELYLETYLTGRNIDLNQLLIQFDEFDQEFITSKHIQGSLTSKMILEMVWDEQGIFQPHKLHARAALVVENGQLNNLPILEEFSTFIKVNDLKKVKFTKLHNLLEIKNREIFITETFIQSNAVNINLSGVHTFDLQMDYALQINAGQVLMNKFKKHDPNLTPKKARQKGLLNVNYRISGFPENLQFGSDKRTVDKMLRESDEKRDQIRNFLISKFGPDPIFFDTSLEKLDFFGSDLEEETYIDF